MRIALQRMLGLPALLALLASAALTNAAPAVAADNHGPYEPTAESIARHRVPEWFEDAKFGMFIDWGLYSVAGWAPLPPKGPAYPDWYLYRMYTDPRFIDYHARTWGKDFARDDFIPLFTAKAYDPQKLADIAKSAGMKYVVPFCKHHDGFCLWPTETTGRNAGKLGPHRDLVRPLVDACRARGLKFGFYTSLEEWEYPLLGDGPQSESQPERLRIWNTSKPAFIGPYDARAMKGKITGKIPVHDYVADYLVPQTEDFIDRYDPDILWFDGDWTSDAQTYHSPEMVAHFYNHAAGRKEVAVNDRLGKTRSKAGDFYTSEYGGVDGKPFDLAKGRSHKWEENRGISQSFGYNRLDTEKSVITGPQLVHMLVDTVAHNGNLLLIVNLDGEGGLPRLEADRLTEIGKWLDVNGEAIYATRPWDRADDGPGVRFTRSKDGGTLYAICFDWPKKELSLPGVTAAEGSQVHLLGSPRPLAWRQGGDGMLIEMPEKLEKPCDDAWAFKIALKP